VRGVLIPVLVLLVTAGLLSGLGCLVYGYHGSLQETVKWTGRQDQGDIGSSVAVSKYTEVKANQNITSVPSSCSSSPCLGGGTCESHDGTFTCYCVPDRGGQFCEAVVKRSPRGSLLVGQFTGQSYVKLRNVATTGPRTSIRIKLRTVRTDGLILFSSLDIGGENTGNISLSLLRGLVQFKYYMGEDYLFLQSPYKVNLGSWHNLVLQTYHGDVMLKLDTQEPILGSLQGGKLAGLGSEVFIGGVSQSGVVKGFQGCLKDLKFSHQAVSLVSKAEPLLIYERGVGECRIEFEKEEG